MVIRCVVSGLAALYACHASVLLMNTEAVGRTGQSPVIPAEEQSGISDLMSWLEHPDTKWGIGKWRRGEPRAEDATHLATIERMHRQSSLFESLASHQPPPERDAAFLFNAQLLVSEFAVQRREFEGNTGQFVVELIERSLGSSADATDPVEFGMLSMIREVLAGEIFRAATKDPGERALLEIRDRLLRLDLVGPVLIFWEAELTRFEQSEEAELTEPEKEAVREFRRGFATLLSESASTPSLVSDCEALEDRLFGALSERAKMHAPTPSGYLRHLRQNDLMRLTLLALIEGRLAQHAGDGAAFERAQHAIDKVIKESALCKNAVIRLTPDEEGVGFRILAGGSKLRPAGGECTDTMRAFLSKLDYCAHVAWPGRPSSAQGAAPTP